MFLIYNVGSVLGVRIIADVRGFPIGKYRLTIVSIIQLYNSSEPIRSRAEAKSIKIEFKVKRNVRTRQLSSLQYIPGVANMNTFASHIEKHNNNKNQNVYK